MMLGQRTMLATWIVLLFSHRAVARRALPQRGEADLNITDAQEYGKLQRNTPFEVTLSIQSLEVRSCSLRLIDSLIETRKKCGREGTYASVVDAAMQVDEVKKAFEKALKATGTESESQELSILTNENDAESLAEDYEACGLGLDFVTCAKSLPPTDWLVQRWDLENYVQLNKKLSNADKLASQAKALLFSNALKTYGFSVKHTDQYCRSFFDKPKVEDVRRCVEEDIVPDFLEGKGYTRWQGSSRHVGATNEQASMDGFGTLSLSSEDRSKEDSEKLSNALKNWLANRWELEDEKNILEKVGKRHSKEVCGTEYIKEVNEWRAWYAKVIKGVGFSVQSAVKECEKRVQTPSTLQAALERASAEVVGSCDKDKDCTAQPGTMCPEGSTCDCQRPYTPKKAGIAFQAAIVGTHVAAIGGGALVGLITGGPPGAAAGATAGLVIPGKIPASLGIAAAFSRKWFPECMCFPLECKYDKKADTCKLGPTKSMRVTGNPFSAIPYPGFKCVKQGKKKCARLECSYFDAQFDGPQMPSGKSLYGKVGQYADGSYNCASTEGNKLTIFSYLDKLPSADGNEVDNTPANRAELLKLYEPAKAT